MISPELDVKVSHWISDIILNKKILIENIIYESIDFIIKPINNADTIQQL